MEAPSIPVDEQVRIETLRKLHILDSKPEERFDRLTRLAKRMFGVPISLVSLVDSNRQWFKSKQGIDADETPRDISFCGHAILGDEIFVVTDALEDLRFADNPLVNDNPNIRFYAGCPLKVFNGSKLGTLCIIDQEPRDFPDEDQKLLKDLAAMAEQELAAVQLAMLDELTLISNRRGFMALAQHALQVAARKNLTLHLLLFDLNKFKQINDQFGHAEGDRALVNFANIMRSVFRESDIFARLGGDEFVALISDTDDKSIDMILKRFKNTIDDYNQREKRGYEILFSVGHVCIAPESSHRVEDLMAQADKKMYSMKNAG